MNSDSPLRTVAESTENSKSLLYLFMCITTKNNSESENQFNLLLSIYVHADN
jgi:hypothetical protein